MRSKTLVLAAALAGCASAFAGAPAGAIAYMSSTGGEPWGSSSNIDAMNAAFGAGQWDHIGFSDGYSGYAFVFIDGSDAGGSEFRDFVTANQADLQAYVGWGGRLFLNAATNGLQGQSYGLGFGGSTVEGDSSYSSTGTLTTDGLPLAAFGAGTNWSGPFFAHNAISSGLPVLITGDSGQTVVAGGSYGLGYVMLGGQTTTNWHWSDSGGNPFQLRVNELTLAAGVNAVPEPETYALLLVGLGAVGMRARRRRPG